MYRLVSGFILLIAAFVGMLLPHAFYEDLPSEFLILYLAGGYFTIYGVNMIASAAFDLDAQNLRNQKSELDDNK